MIKPFAQKNLENQIQQVFQSPAIAITINPYQGLKHLLQLNPPTQRIAITINPYQGLKLADFSLNQSPPAIAITINPYQGLKQ